MKSITTKLSAAMIVCMVAAVTLVSVIYRSKTLELNREDSQKIIQFIRDDSVHLLDAQLTVIEHSVELLVQHASDFLSDAECTPQEQLRRLEDISLSTAQCTEEVVSIYFHGNPELYGPSMNFYYLRDPATDTFIPGVVYDPITYQEMTGAVAEWYYASADSGQSCWLQPYLHSLDGYYGEPQIIASYTVPLYNESGALLGVLGVDHTFDHLAQALRDIDLYNSGYAFLICADGSLLLHPQLPFGPPMTEFDPQLYKVIDLIQQGSVPETLFSYQYYGDEKLLTYAPLRNNTYLVVCAPTKEINASVNRIGTESRILFAVVLVSSVMIVYCLIYRFIRPLQLLTQASQQVIQGNMQVSLDYHAQDEIGELTENFLEMVRYLQDHISKINTMAHTDAMTGLQNKAAYQAAVHLLQERIDQGFSEFGMVVFDLNNLKQTNDTLGHAAGDKLIKNAAYVVSKTFGETPVYRIGGDEFAAILEGEDLLQFERREEELERLTHSVNQDLPPEQWVSIAYGMCRFQAGQDQNFRQVFARADQAMYGCKQRMKQKQFSAAPSQGPSSADTVSEGN